AFGTRREHAHGAGRRVRNVDRAVATHGEIAEQPIMTVGRPLDPADRTARREIPCHESRAARVARDIAGRYRRSTDAGPEPSLSRVDAHRVDSETRSRERIAPRALRAIGCNFDNRTLSHAGG